MIRRVMFLDMQSIGPGERRESFDVEDGWTITELPDGRIAVRHPDHNGGLTMRIRGDYTAFEAPDPDPADEGDRDAKDPDDPILKHVSKSTSFAPGKGKRRR